MLFSASVRPGDYAENANSTNHAANDSPRSGSSKKVAPVVWAVIVIAIACTMTIWYAMQA